MNSKSALRGGCSRPGDVVAVAPKRKGSKKKKKGSKKVKFAESYSYIQDLKDEIATNWTVKISKGGAIKLICWTDDGKDSSYNLSWMYIDPQSGFMHVGNKTRKFRVSVANRYFNSNFKNDMQSWETVESILISLRSPFE